ncbi:hypothetical protein [Candidatus Entotheonella palauensis]|uniref:hypothetical protein n=1 Tax=Candidatus Entotheonella palauensis TaxID=93172 RepID=UPI001178345D|nr:hypothetical protein [Candidatus Entotheonella palauensis]
MGEIDCRATSVGGIHGLVMLAGLIPASEKMQEAGTVSYIVFAILLVLNIIAGVLLWFKQRRGFVWSITLQFLQAVRITFGAVNYGFHTLISVGVFIRFRKGNSGFGIDFEFLDTYFYIYTKIIYKLNLYLPFDVVVNVSALLCFFYLYFIFDRLFPMERSHPLQETTESAFTDQSAS